MKTCSSVSVPLEVSIPSGNACCRCRHPSPELLFVGCGCKMHVMCVPTSTICKREGEAKSHDAITCPNCGKSASEGIYLYPIDVQSLEQMILCQTPKLNNQLGNNIDCSGDNVNKNDPSAALEEFYASIAPLFLLTWTSQSGTERRPSSTSCSDSTSSTSSSTASSSYNFQAPTSTFTDDDVSFRNGRWSSEEVRFVDAAMKSFDEGDLPVSKGITLNDFLRSLLLCKSTRLRKKIKNANFCTRTYCPRVNALEGDGGYNVHTMSATNNAPTSVPPMNDLTMKLADQQQNFVYSIDEDIAAMNNIATTAGTLTSYSYDRNLLKFSLRRTWGMLFWKFCSEVRYANLLSDDWWKGLEDIEEKAVAAKNKKKRALRRKRVDFVSNNGISGGQHGNYVDNPSQMQCNSSATTNTTTSLQQRLPFILDNTTNTLKMDYTKNPIHTSQNLVNVNVQQAQQQQPQQLTLPSDKDVPLHLQSKRARLVNDVLSDPPGHISDVADICNQLSDWNPFIEKVTKFVVDEHLPFQYFDIWISDKKNTNTNTGKNVDDGYEEIQYRSSIVGRDNNVSLRHVGHATNPETDCIFTIYHMNEFGRYSSNFKFTPGIGLPGRVYNTGMPTWDDSLETATLDDFPRVDGARNHGLKKALGIPLPGRTREETIVIALYSAGEITKTDSLMQKCCMEFQRYRPNVKWELVLDIGHNVDIGNNDSTDSNTLALSNQDSKRKDSLDDTDYLASTNAEEEEIINILGRYVPMENSTNLFGTNLQESFMSLRLLLLRTPSRRSDEEIGVIETLKRSYRHYLQADRKENEVAMLLANDWTVLRSDCNSQLNKPVHPITINMTEVNYANLTRDRTPMLLP